MVNAMEAASKKNAMENNPINYLEDRMYRMPDFAKQVMTTKEVQQTLKATNNFVIAGGRGYKLNIKNLGAGMKEVSLIPFDN